MSSDCFSHPCSSHDQPIVNICAAPRCCHRVLCQICLDSHQKSHLTFIKTLKDAWTNFEIDSEYENISHLITQRTQTYNAWVEELYGTLGKLTLMITKTVEEVKTDVEREAQKTHNLLIDELKANREALKGIKSECANVGCVGGSNLKDRYAELYASFISKNYEFNKSIQVQDVQRHGFTVTLNKIFADTKEAFQSLKKNVNNSLKDFSLMDLKIKNLLNNYHYEEALNLAKESQDIKKDLFVESSMEVAKSFRVLGRILQKMQHNSAARENLQKSNDLASKHLKADDPFLAEGYQLISECFLNEEILGRSYNTLVKAQNIYLSKGGSENPALVGVNLIMARIFIKQSSYVRALELLNATEKSALQHFGTESEQMASVLLYKQLALEKLGKGTGVSGFERTLNLTQKLYGEKSIEAAVCYQVIAKIVSNDEEKIQYIDKAINILSELFPEDKSPRIGILYGLKAKIVLSSDFDEALKLAEKGLQIVLAQVGRNSSHAAIANEHIAKIWSAKDRLKGMYYVKEALNIVQHIYNNHNSRSVHYMEKLAEVAIVNKNIPKIVKNLEEALASRKAIYRLVEFRLAEGFLIFPEVRPEPNELYLNEFKEGVKAILAGLKRDFAPTVDSPAFSTLAMLCCRDENYMKALADFEDKFKAYKDEAKKIPDFMKQVLERLVLVSKKESYERKAFEQFVNYVSIFDL